MIYEKLASIASSKGLHENAWQIFLRGIGCNWLVCLGVWIALAADSVGSKVLGMFFPIMAFVAMGFDHVVANMFFLPAAIFAGVPGLDWGEVLHNWVFAFLGTSWAPSCSSRPRTGTCTCARTMPTSRSPRSAVPERSSGGTWMR